MVSLDDAREYVLHGCEPLGSVERTLAEASGLVLAEQLIAAELVPPFANSAMDGFAVRSDDARGPVQLRIVGTIAAGSNALPEVGPGEAVRIMTGAPVPPGADAVEMVELCEVTGEVLTLSQPVPLGKSIREAGDDIAIGDMLAEPGVVVTPALVGLAATIGRDRLMVYPKPVVGVLSTGDELVEPGVDLGPGQIRDSNRAALLACLRADGFETVDLGLIADDREAIETAILHGVQRCDALITSGGVSMGDFDFVKEVLSRIAEMRWMQVAIRPAKPLAFGVIDSGGRSIPVFGLPGNPVSSLVSFELFARPALMKMAGRADQQRRMVRAVVDQDFRRKPDGKIHFSRVQIRQDAELVFQAVSSGGQGSHHMASMARANGLLRLDDGEGLEGGDSAAVMLLS